jgi:hypothetical protein
LSAHSRSRRSRREEPRRAALPGTRCPSLRRHPAIQGVVSGAWEGRCGGRLKFLCPNPPRGFTM